MDNHITHPENAGLIVAALMGTEYSCNTNGYLQFLCAIYPAMHQRFTRVKYFCQIRVAKIYRSFVLEKGSVDLD